MKKTRERREKKIASCWTCAWTSITIQRPRLCIGNALWSTHTSILFETLHQPIAKKKINIRTLCWSALFSYCYFEKKGNRSRRSRQDCFFILIKSTHTHTILVLFFKKPVFGYLLPPFGIDSKYTRHVYRYKRHWSDRDSKNKILILVVVSDILFK